MLATRSARLPSVRIVSLATMLAAAASVHLLLTPRHFRESTLFGVFVLGVTALRFGIAGAGAGVGTIFRWTPWIMAGSLALLVAHALHLRLRTRERSDG